MEKSKVAVAMSGGVDSGVAAALLVKAGYKVAGFHLHLWAEKRKEHGFENKCCSTESLEAARKTASLLKIPFYTLNFEDIFKKQVVDYFLAEFRRGKTPNPCVMCNRHVKFGHLLPYVKKLGYDYLATGHYARIIGEDAAGPVGLHPHPTSSSGGHRTAGVRWGTPVPATRRFTYHLLSALDPKKDQSYFLYNLTQKQLVHILFPVGEYTKVEVRKMARQWRLPVADRPESQEICFFPENDYRPFLKRQIPEKIKPGEVVDLKGNVIGEHGGLPFYTIGQRHGFRVKPRAKDQGPKVILPLYVVEMDSGKNQLIVGWGKETERGEFEVEDANWINPGFKESKILKAKVRIRHQGELYSCQIKLKDGKVQVALNEPVRSVTPGQAAVFYKVFYQDEEVLGGGTIRGRSSG